MLSFMRSLGGHPGLPVATVASGALVAALLMREDVAALEAPTLTIYVILLGALPWVFVCATAWSSRERAEQGGAP